MNVKYEQFLYLERVKILRHFILLQGAITFLLSTQPDYGSSLYFRVRASWANDVKGLVTSRKFIS